MNNILFVCMGNICRSPSAEGFFKHHLAQSAIAGQVSADSAGTHSYHIGCAPDHRAIAEAENYGIDISNLRARKLRRDDFEQFDLILGMDQHNLQLISQLKPANSRAETALMMDYAPDSGFDEVPDPYYGAQQDFKLMCDLLDQATKNLLSRLVNKQV